MLLEVLRLSLPEQPPPKIYPQQVPQPSPAALAL